MRHLLHHDPPASPSWRRLRRRRDPARAGIVIQPRPVYAAAPFVWVEERNLGDISGDKLFVHLMRGEEWRQVRDTLGHVAPEADMCSAS